MLMTNRINRQGTLNNILFKDGDRFRKSKRNFLEGTVFTQTEGQDEVTTRLGLVGEGGGKIEGQEVNSALSIDGDLEVGGVLTRGV